MLNLPNVDPYQLNYPKKEGGLKSCFLILHTFFTTLCTACPIFYRRVSQF